MTASLTANEEAQLSQTIEMFEVITQSQPQDYQSLEILKEAYFKLGREQDVVATSKRIAQAYVQFGQLSSAILEYESILQRFPGDPDVRAALGEIESKANNFSAALPAPVEMELAERPVAVKPAVLQAKAPASEVDDGRQTLHKIFVEGKIISSADFNIHWPKNNPNNSPKLVRDPFIQILADKQVVPIETSMKLICDKARCAYLPLDKYDIDMEFARSFPRETCYRWCVLPFDQMSKSVLVATANPFNKQAALELEEAAGGRLLWYLTQPPELLKILRKLFH